MIVKNKITQYAEEIDDFLELAIEEGCEGLVIKDLQGVYRAGAREYLWIKLKREYKSEMSDTFRRSPETMQTIKMCLIIRNYAIYTVDISVFRKYC